MRRIPVLLLAVLALLTWSVSADEPDRQIAITIDDLPWQNTGNAPDPELAGNHARLLAQLREADVPVTGFVNEIKLEVDGQVQPERVQMLRDWLDAGHDLGNHGYSHLDLTEVGVEAYQQDLLRGQQVLVPLLAEHGRKPRWFRHPYLRAGRDAADRQAMDAFLRAHGYQVAPVTVDNSEWIWAHAYARVRDGRAPTADQDGTLERLRLGYVPYMLNKVDHFQRLSLALLGYPLPQVWLLHANALNADTFAELVRAVQRRGYRVVSLEQAMADPAYARGEGGYVGGRGISWLDRWALAEGRTGTFFAGEPMVPGWVLALADMDSE